MTPGIWEALGRYAVARIGFVALFVLVGGTALRFAGGGRAGSDGRRPAGQAEPVTLPEVMSRCREQGWPERLPSGVSDPVAPPGELPGAFPPEGRLGKGALGLAPLRAEFRNPATLLRRKAALLERLATGLAIRARYFYALSRSLPDRPTADSRRRAAGRPLGRRVYTKAAALRRFAKAAAAADFYYRRVSGRVAKYVDRDRLAYEHAALLLYVGQRHRARRLLERLVAEMPDSRYAAHARAYLGLLALAEGHCRRAEELVGKTSGLGALGSLGGAVAAGLGRCVLSAGDPGRALGLARQAIGLLARSCVPADGTCRPWMARALTVALSVLAQGAAAAGTPAQFAAEARGLPAPLGVLAAELLLDVYRKKNMIREAAELCRLAGKFVEGGASKANQTWVAWQRLARRAGKGVPADRRIALGIRSPAAGSAHGGTGTRRRTVTRRQGGNAP